MVRLAIIAALTVTLLAAPTIGGIVDLPIGFITDRGASAADFSCGPYQPVDPAGGVAHQVATQEELAAALAAAGPGDTINLASARYHRINYRRDHGHRSGTAAAPIIIQAAQGANPIVDPGDGDLSPRFAVAVDRVAHVTVRGLEIRNGFFGALSRGSTAITFEHNHIHRTGQVGVVTDAAEGDSGFEPSSATVIRCNSIHDTGLLEPEYGEGIYVGNGGTGAVDRTTDVLIEGNDIHSIANEAIDVKRYTTNVTIRHNLIHDVTPYYGGAISLGLNKNNWGPANYLVEHNRIWNVSTGRHYAQAIAVAHGPTAIRNNVIWNIDTKVSDTWPWTAAVQVHGDDNDADWAYGFGNGSATAVEITGNTIIGCRQGCIDSYTDAGQIKPTLTVNSNTVDRASTGDAANSSDLIVSAAELTGPLTGTADSGSGPGSGLRLRATPPTTAAPQPTSTAPRRPSTTTAATVPSTSSAPARPSASPSSATRTDAGPQSPPGSVSPSNTADRSGGAAAPEPGRTRSQRSSSVPAETSGPTNRSTSRRSGSVTPTPAVGSTSSTRAVPGGERGGQGTRTRRRGPSDLRLFLDLNLGPMAPAAGEPPGSAVGPTSDSPGWLVDLMTPSAVDDSATTSSPTVIDRTGPSGENATTTADGPGRSRSTTTSSDGELPTTTRPAATAGLTTVGDMVERTTMP